MDTPGARLKWAREHKSAYKTATDAARAFGWPISTYLGHENGDRSPSRKAAKAYAAAYKVPWDWLLEGGALPDSGQNRDPSGPAEERRLGTPLATEAIRAPDAPLPPLRSEMPKDVPVLGVVVGGDARSMVDFEVNGEVADYVRRPPRFQGRRDIFAVYVTGQSMEPWAEPGQLLYLETAKPARNLDYVLVELKPHDGEGIRPALIKRLVAVTPSKIKLRQYNPPRDIEIDRASVLRVCRVVDLAEMMGV